MATFLKTAGIIVVMVLLIPIAVFAATGRVTRAWEALRDYLIAMGVIVVPTLVVAGLALLSR